MTMSKKRGLRLFAAGAAVVWCIVFSHCETTDKSMIRAVILEQSGGEWTAGFLYQTPEASADASEASAQVAFSAAEGDTLSLALSAAERTLPRHANYRLCDYLLITQGSAYSVLDAYEQEVIQRQCGRLAARVISCGFDCAGLSAQSEETDALPEKLLESVKQSAASAPRLYESSEAGLVLPQVALCENGVETCAEGVLITREKTLVLTEEQAQAANLLYGRAAGETVFRLGSGEVRARRAVCSLTSKVDGFILRLDCLSSAGEPKVSEEQRREIGEALTSTAYLLWANGIDALDLSARRELSYGSGAAIDPQKSACPQLQADVRFYDISVF